MFNINVQLLSAYKLLYAISFLLLSSTKFNRMLNLGRGNCLIFFYNIAISQMIYNRKPSQIYILLEMCFFLLKYRNLILIWQDICYVICYVYYVRSIGSKYVLENNNYVLWRRLSTSFRPICCADYTIHSNGGNYQVPFRFTLMSPKP